MTSVERSNPKRRILQVVYRMDCGGVETWLMNVLRHIDHARFQIDFLTHSDTPGEYDAEIRSFGSRILRCCHPADLIRHRQEMAAILRENGPFDVVHTHDPHWDGVAMKTAARAAIPKRVVHSHADWSRFSARTPWQGLYLRYSRYTGARYATHGLACSAAAAFSYAGNRWAEDSRWRVFFCGQDLTSFSKPVDCRAIRSELGIPEKAFVVGHVGNFRAEKNHLFLLRIAAELARRSDAFRFLLVGDGESRQNAELMARSLGISERTIFAGARQDVSRLLLGAMDLFLFPSKFEGLGLSLVEAQAAGLRCVCSDVLPSEAIVVPELVMRISLRLAPAEWAHAIEKMLREKVPVAKDRALCSIQASKFNLRNSISEIESLYWN